MDDELWGAVKEELLRAGLLGLLMLALIWVFHLVLQLADNEAKESSLTIYVWPDHSWVYEDEYCWETDRWRGDDFMKVGVPPEVEDIDEWLNQTRPQDSR